MIYDILLLKTFLIVKQFEFFFLSLRSVEFEEKPITSKILCFEIFFALRAKVKSKKVHLTQKFKFQSHREHGNACKTTKNFYLNSQ